MKSGSINYIDVGPREAQPLVFIHAFPLNYRQWAQQIKELSTAYRVIAYDVRGHGESDVGDGPPTMDLFVDDLMGLLDYLKIEKAVVCSLSMGGYIALRAVERYPERLSGLVLCDTRSEADSDEAKLKRVATIKQIKDKGVAAFADVFVKPAFAPETFTSNPTVVLAVKEMITNNSVEGICGTLMALACRTDTTHSLSQIQIPTLILVGEYDQITPLSGARAMKERIPTAQMHTIPQAGHFSNLENPVEFNLRLHDFLGKILTPIQQAFDGK